MLSQRLITMRKKYLKHSTSGLTLSEALVSIGILSALILVVSSGVTSALTLKSQIDVEKALANRVNQIISLLNSSNAWNQMTLSPLNNQMACLTVDPSIRDCRGAVTSLVTIIDAEGATIFNPSNQGLDQYGQVCDLNEQNCEFLLSIEWTPICNPNDPCPNPLNRFQGRLQPKDVQKWQKINFSKFNFDFIQGRESSSLRSICESMYGQFDPNSLECELPLWSGGDCPDPLVVIRITEQMTKVCGPLWQGACRPTDFMVGLDGNGRPICRPKPVCPPPPPPPDRKSVV